MGIELDREHVGAALRHGHGERAGTGAGLDHEVLRPDIRLLDEAVSGLGTQEVLTETASSLVPGRPPTGGHGASPWWSSPFGLPPDLSSGNRIRRLRVPSCRRLRAGASPESLRSYERPLRDGQRRRPSPPSGDRP